MFGPRRPSPPRGMLQAPKPTQPSLEKGYEDSYNSKPTQPPPTVSIPKPVTTPIVPDLPKGGVRGPVMPVFGPPPMEPTPEEKKRNAIELREKQKANSSPVYRTTPKDLLGMAVGKTPANLKYDANKDGRITSSDALAYAKTPQGRMSEKINAMKERSATRKAESAQKIAQVKADIAAKSAARKEASAAKKEAKKDTKKYAKGGKIDGCARKGKTKGRMV